MEFSKLEGEVDDLERSHDNDCIKDERRQHTTVLYLLDFVALEKKTSIKEASILYRIRIL